MACASQPANPDCLRRRFRAIPKTLVDAQGRKPGLLLNLDFNTERTVRTYFTSRIPCEHRDRPFLASLRKAVVQDTILCDHDLHAVHVPAVEELMTGQHRCWVYVGEEIVGDLCVRGAQHRLRWRAHEDPWYRVGQNQDAVLRSERTKLMMRGNTDVVGAWVHDHFEAGSQIEFRMRERTIVIIENDRTLEIAFAV